MKPCSHHRKQIAWLAAGVLDSEPAQKLVAHLQQCPGCREYEREISIVCREQSARAGAFPSVTPGASFHRRLVQRVHAAQGKTRSGLSQLFPSWILSWRAALPAAALVLALCFAWQPDPSNPVSPPAVVEAEVTLSQPDTAQPPPPTLSVYRNRANQSLEALDDLLDQHTVPAPGAGERFHVAALMQRHLDQ
jgi:hypothetical protein